MESVDSSYSAIDEGGGWLQAVDEVLASLLVVADPGQGSVIRCVAVSCVVVILWFCSLGTAEVGVGVPGKGRSGGSG